MKTMMKMAMMREMILDEALAEVNIVSRSGLDLFQ